MFTKAVKISSSLLKLVTIETLGLGILVPATLSGLPAKAMEAGNFSQNLVAQSPESSQTLTATAQDGTPEELTEENWLAASGEASVSAVDADNYTVAVEASNLVPNGLYTLWWVNDQLIGKEMGPAGGIPDNQFRADSEGNATTTISVPSGNDYQMIAIAYHADDQTHGENPGEMGEVTFTHLMGNFPKPS